MMLYKPFRQVQELLGEYVTFAAAYTEFLQFSNVPVSLEDDIHELEQSSQQSTEDDNPQVCLYEPVYLLLITILNSVSSNNYH